MCTCSLGTWLVGTFIRRSLSDPPAPKGVSWRRCQLVGVEAAEREAQAGKLPCGFSMLPAASGDHHCYPPRRRESQGGDFSSLTAAKRQDWNEGHSPELTAFLEGTAQPSLASRTVEVWMVALPSSVSHRPPHSQPLVTFCSPRTPVPSCLRATGCAVPSAWNQLPFTSSGLLLKATPQGQGGGKRIPGSSVHPDAPMSP